MPPLNSGSEATAGGGSAPAEAEGSQGTSLVARRTEKSLRSFLMERGVQSLRRSNMPPPGLGGGC